MFKAFEFCIPTVRRRGGLVMTTKDQLSLRSAYLITAWCATAAKSVVFVSRMSGRTWSDGAEEICDFGH
jgi:hypothetical protein